MYAVIRSGGKAYKVQPGDSVRVAKRDVKPGERLELKEVLLCGGEKLQVGEPYVKDAKVTAVVTHQGRGPKILVFKKNRRQGYRRTQGHRQDYTELFIESISSSEGSQVADKQAHVRGDKKITQKKETAPKKTSKSSKPSAKKTLTSNSKKAPSKKVTKKKTVKEKS